MRRWFSEPLVHFLILGGLLFGAHGWINRGNDDPPRVLRVTAAEVNWLAETWTKQWQRQPSEEELRGLVADYVKEELLAREAKEVGLDENDTIVRRRLAQKMEFLVQDTARLAEPGEDELRRLYDTEPARYRTPACISFTQIFFKTETAARTGLAQVALHGPAQVGDHTLLDREYATLDEQTLATLFGEQFARQVFALEPDRWLGPVPSAYGFHLVRVNGRENPLLRHFGEVRTQVLEDWHRAQQARVNEQFFDGLLKKYEVVVDETVRPLMGPFAKVGQ
ncbi:MAG: peptidyl-prolyl cis-trans isomerase [Nitrospira sp. LK70]|nr:peptidyl-prolyl cis-trans isomerase [Nitrospira sp. LK70]